MSKKYGAEIPFIRPKALSTDKASSLDVIEHAITFMKKKYSYSPDFICLLQPTSPLRSERHLNEAIELLIGKKADACVSVCSAKINPYLVNYVEDGMFKNYIPYGGRNYVKKLEPVKLYMLNGAIYLIRPEIFLKEKTLEPKNTAAYMMSDYDSLDIDTLTDFKIAEFIAKENMTK